MRMLIVFASAIILASCCSIPDQAKLPLPPEANLPKLTDAELACVTDHTYEKIATLDNQCKERIKTLENIIKTTH